MRHTKIPKSRKHKKLKSFGCNEWQDDEESNQIKHISKRNEEKFRDQTIPRKLQELMDSSKKYHDIKKLKKKKKKTKNELISVRAVREADDYGMTRSLKPLPEIVSQGPYESEYQFIHRLEKLSAKARAEANIEDRFDVDFCPKMDSQDSNHSINNNDKSDNKNKSEEVKVRKRSIKRKEKLIKKKAKKLAKQRENDDDFKHLKDDVKFGETVLQPPELTHFIKRNFKHKNEKNVQIKKIKT